MIAWPYALYFHTSLASSKMTVSAFFIRLRFGALLILLAGSAASCDYAPEWYDADDYDQIYPPGSVLALHLAESDADAGLPADGYSQLRLVARFSGERIDSTKRTVVFTTSAGTLAQSDAGGAATRMEVDLKSDNRAAVTLTAANTVGQAQIQAALKSLPEVGDTLSVAFVPVDADAVLTFVDPPSEAVADGATETVLRIQLDSNLPPAQRTVVVTTTAGSFDSENPKELTLQNVLGDEVSIPLTSPTDVTSAVIRARVATVSQEITLPFIRALPEAISVSIDPAVLSLGSNMTATVSAQTARARGTATQGTMLAFDVVPDSAGARPGYITNVTTTNNTGLATATFVPTDETYAGRVTIAVRHADTGVEGSGTILLVPEEDEDEDDNP